MTEYTKQFFCTFSSGFGVESSKDNMVAFDDGTKRQLVCGTEKGKHKCKNHRTAGNSINIVVKAVYINFLPINLFTKITPYP